MEINTDLKMRIQIVEGDAMFSSLTELAEIMRQQAELARRAHDLANEIRDLLVVKCESKPN